MAVITPIYLYGTNRLATSGGGNSGNYKSGLQVWVDATSPQGSNAVRTGTNRYKRDVPYLTIQQAINESVDGDTIIIQANTYNEVITVAAGKKLRLILWDAIITTIDFSTPSTANELEIFCVGKCSITNLLFNGNGIKHCLKIFGNNALVIGTLTVTRFDNANCTSFILQGFEVTGGSSFELTRTGGGADFTSYVYDCQFRRASVGYAFAIRHGVIVFWNCTFVNTAGDLFGGITFNNMATMDFHECIFSCTGTYYPAGAALPSVSYNLVTKNAFVGGLFTQINTTVNANVIV